MTEQPLQIALAFNLRTEKTEEQAERLDPEYIADVHAGLERLGHQVEDLDMAGTTKQVLQRLRAIDPDLVFNLAEGDGGAWREAHAPLLFRFLGYPFTGAGPGALGLALDKRLAEDALEDAGVAVPGGALVTPERPRVPDDLQYPAFVKPNFGGSSIGIHADSVVEDREEAQALVDRLLPDHPEGLDVERYIPGRELAVGYLAHAEPPLLPVVETVSDNERNILDYEAKQDRTATRTVCPAPLSAEVRQEVTRAAGRAMVALGVRDFGRVDLRLAEDGTPYVLEVNPLPGLRRGVSPLMVAADAQGLGHDDVLACIVAAAVARQSPTKNMAAEVLR